SARAGERRRIRHAAVRTAGASRRRPGGPLPGGVGRIQQLPAAHHRGAVRWTGARARLVQLVAAPVARDSDAGDAPCLGGQGLRSARSDAADMGWRDAIHPGGPGAPLALIGDMALVRPQFDPGLNPKQSGPLVEERAAAYRTSIAPAS